MILLSAIMLATRSGVTVDKLMLTIYRVAWVAVIVLILLNMPACNTIHGLGLDLQKMSEGVGG